MSNLETTWIALDDTEFCSFTELLTSSGLNDHELAELVDTGAIVAHRPNPAATALFSLRYLAVARTARNLRDDFELDHHGIALAIRLLARIEALQQELARARAGTLID